jgi:hypothetical protein
VLAGCFLTACTTPDLAMPDVRGKSCTYYAARIAELTGTVEQKQMEAQAETAGFMAASVGLSLLVPFAGLALIPAEQEAKRDTYQAQSDLWTFRAAYEAKECLPVVAQGEVTP